MTRKRIDPKAIRRVCMLATWIAVSSVCIYLPAQSEPFTAPERLVRIDSEKNVEFASGDESRSVTIDQVSRWGALAELRGPETLILSDGSLLCGSTTRIDSRGAALGHDVFDPTEIPRDSLRGIVLQRPASDRSFDQLVIRLSRDTFTSDTLLLENGDTIAGSLATLPNDDTSPQTTIAIDVNGTRLETPLDRITAVAFRTTDNPKQTTSRFHLGLRKGDYLQVRSITTGRGSVTLSLAAGVQLTTAGDFLWPDVTYLTADASDETQLADMPTLSYRHLPKIGWQLPLGLNTNVLGGRLRTNGSVYASGLGMPGSSHVAFRLDGTQRRFAATLAVDDAAGSRGSVVFRVFGKKEKGDLHELFISETIRGGDTPIPTEIDIQGISLLVLLVDAADRSDELDYANWLDARVIK